jgi:hypothetical protein
MSTPRHALLAALALGSACSTVTPMQTASVVDLGTFRVGGQLSAAGFCGDLGGGVLGLTRCADYPDGIPLPELRLDGRYGFFGRFDVGASLQVQGQLFAPSRPFQAGLTVDVKTQLISATTGPVTHVVSLGALASGAVAGRLSLPPWYLVEWGFPLFYGLQLERWELVAGVQWSQRYGLGPSGTIPRMHVGFTLGAFRRNPAGFAIQLAYLTDPDHFTSGAPQLQVGWFFDL